MRDFPPLIRKAFGVRLLALPNRALHNGQRLLLVSSAFPCRPEFSSPYPPSNRVFFRLVIATLLRLSSQKIQALRSDYVSNRRLHLRKRLILIMNLSSFAHEPY